jgi:hypothetical protein
MKQLKIFRETALPGTTQADSIYIIAPAGTPNYVEIYVTNSSNQLRRIINQADITALINSAVQAATELTIVADIAARNALNPTRTMYVFVQNATGDATVASGGATYLYNTSNSTWIKVSEAESLDVVVSWASITGKPSSSVAAIDAAVAASHTHANKTQLDKVGENAEGLLTYNGQLPPTRWESTGW